MTLEYSFKADEELYHSGRPPLGDVPNTKIHVIISSSASSDGYLPPVFELGDLIITQRTAPTKYAITLLLTYQAGITAPSHEPLTNGKWVSAPNSPILGQIHIPLTLEAIAKIKKVAGEEFVFEINLDAHLSLKNPSA